MWIETTNRDSDGNPVTRRLKAPFMDSAVEFSENGKAQVTGDVGEALCAEYDAIQPVGGSSDGDDAPEADADESTSDTGDDSDAADDDSDGDSE